MKNKKLLYLYKPLSTLEHFTWLQNYINQKVWFTRLDKFNDPFEGKFHFKSAEPKEILEDKTLFETYFIIIKQEDPNLTREELKKILQSSEMVENFGRKQFVDSIFGEDGAICLAKDNSNIPMWAHYSNNHQGYCVIFELDLDRIFEKHKEIRREKGEFFYTRGNFDEEMERLFDPKHRFSDLGIQEALVFNHPGDDPDKKFCFTKVIYKEDIPTLEAARMYKLTNEYDKYKYLSQCSFGVKFKQWEYEEEYRLFVNANSDMSGHMDLRGYGFIKITGIIMGCNIGKTLSDDALNFIRHYELCGYKFKEDAIEKKVQEFVKHLAYKRGVNTFLASCSQEKYEINIEKI